MKSTTCKSKGSVGKFPNKILNPNQRCTRDEFYTSTENLRYAMSIHLINGQQASDINIGIENLIEFVGDVEIYINNVDNVSVCHKNHTHWTVKINIGDKTEYNEINAREFESDIEDIAEDHGIALMKETSLSGRGYNNKGCRIISVDYRFGTYRENSKKFINSSDYPTANIKWVGGKIGKKDDLHKNNVQIKKVVSKSDFKIWFDEVKSKIPILH